MIDNQRVTLDGIRNSCEVFLKFPPSSESNNKSWDQLTFHTSLPNFSRTCLDILLLINLNSDNKLLQGPFTLCVANNTLVIFSAISLSLFLLSLQPRKMTPHRVFMVSPSSRNEQFTTSQIIFLIQLV